MRKTNNTFVLESAPVLRFRSPRAEDASAIHGLIGQCPPLDLNSCYAYLLQTIHMHDTCVIAEAGQRPVGYVSAYLVPNASDTLFVWQVAVAPAWRGQALGRRMINEILARPACASVRQLETTISPGNDASERLFLTLASQHQARCDVEQLFGNDMFDDPSHAPEHLYRIGPLQGNPLSRQCKALLSNALPAKNALHRERAQDREPPTIKRAV